MALLTSHLVLGGGPAGPEVAQALMAAGVDAAHAPAAAAIRPADGAGLAGWEVEEPEGARTRHAGLVLVPEVAPDRGRSALLERFTGAVLSPGELPSREGRVLVLGAPGPACAAAASLARRGIRVHLAGRPSDLVDRCGPALRTLIKARRVLLRGVVSSIEGQRVRFGGGLVESFATVVHAPAGRIGMPWLDPSLVDWHDGMPRVVGGTLMPGIASLYFCSPRALARQAPLIADLIAAQARTAHPVVDDLAPALRPQALCPDGSPEPRALRRLERRVAAWQAAQDPADVPARAALTAAGAG